MQHPDSGTAPIADGRIPGKTVTSGADDVAERIIAVLSKLLDSELIEVTADSRLQDLSIDSTGVLELLLVIEEDLGVQFDPESLDASNFDTIGSLADLVRASR